VSIDSSSGLLKSEGSANFAGRVNAGGSSADPVQNEPGLAAYNDDGGTTATIFGNNLDSSGTGRLLELRSNNLAKVIVGADGSASFAGRVDIGGTSSTATALTATNSSAAATTIYGRNNIGQKAPVFVAADSTGDARATIYNDGSAIFADGDFNVANDGTLSITTSSGGSGLIQLSDKIVLNGADGSAEFAGDIQVGEDASGALNSGLHLNSSGRYIAVSTPGSAPLWSGYLTGNTETTSQIKADGSAEFAGQIETKSGGIKFPDGTIQTTASTGVSDAYLLKDFSSYPSITSAFTAPEEQEPADSLDVSPY
jgi:hypothetical protein